MSGVVWQLSKREKLITRGHGTQWFVNTISGTTRVCLTRTDSVVQGSHSRTMLFHVDGHSFSPPTAAHALLVKRRNTLHTCTSRMLPFDSVMNVLRSLLIDLAEAVADAVRDLPPETLCGLIEEAAADGGFL